MASPSGTGHDTACPECGKAGLAYRTHVCRSGCVVSRPAPVPADPVVSPADTIRRELYSYGNLDAEQVTLRREDVLALLAVGERDKAALDQADSRATMHQGRAEALSVEVERLDTERERDRQHIAQLTAAIERYIAADEANEEAIAELLLSDPGEDYSQADTARALDEAFAGLRAVLADKEDADNGD